MNSVPPDVQTSNRLALITALHAMDSFGRWAATYLTMATGSEKWDSETLLQTSAFHFQHAGTCIRHRQYELAPYLVPPPLAFPEDANLHPVVASISGTCVLSDLKNVRLGMFVDTLGTWSIMMGRFLGFDSHSYGMYASLWMLCYDDRHIISSHTILCVLHEETGMSQNLYKTIQWIQLGEWTAINQAILLPVATRFFGQDLPMMVIQAGQWKHQSSRKSWIWIW